MRIPRRYILFLAVLGMVPAAFLAGCDKGPQQMQMPTPEVTYLTVKTERVELTSELSGRTSALEVAEVRPQVTGIIQKRLFDEGQEVAEGQQLYQIDPALYEASLAEAKAALLRAEANFTAAQLMANRSAQAVKVNAVSRQENDNAFASMNQARAEVVAAKAAVDTASINIRYTKVNAPIAGHIGISSVTPGALVTANQGQALATIQRMDQMYVDLTQSSAELLRLKRSMMEGRLVSAGDGAAKVKLKLEDGQLYDIEGALQLADITVDTGTGAITVRAKFDNPMREITAGRRERLLFPGMFVRAILQEAVNERGILIPQRAVGRDTMGRATVYCVREVEPTKAEIEAAQKAGKTAEKSTKAMEEVIEIDRSIGKDYLVRSGLNVGDKVILDGRVKVRPGAVVKPVPYVPPKAADAPSGKAADASSGKEADASSGKEADASSGKEADASSASGSNGAPAAK
ncbi:cytoplasmic membrane lipoprotein [uncultured delta proteobacterium]|uniref:Cytoplasmic membrane lipoprotein n=1 Tax=uncultured delta proteobacterium TaxID=34034 RepID=A0A212IVS1_9DELT|nr:cytoplasmic membrane lipoprotein [uncultured delta proteobacterium]